MLTARLTDLLGSGSGDEPQTTEDFPFRVTVPCAATGSSGDRLDLRADDHRRFADARRGAGGQALDLGSGRGPRRRRRTGLGRRHARRQHAVRHAGRLRPVTAATVATIGVYGFTVGGSSTRCTRRTCACCSTCASGAACAGGVRVGERAPPAGHAGGVGHRIPPPQGAGPDDGARSSSTARTTGSASASAHDRSSRRRYRERYVKEILDRVDLAAIVSELPGGCVRAVLRGARPRGLPPVADRRATGGRVRPDLKRLFRSVTGPSFAAGLGVL